MRNGRTVAILAALVALSACAMQRGDARLSMRYEKGIQSFDVDDVISRAGPDGVEIVGLGNTAWVSHHVAVVRTEEKPHYHRFHDMTVFVLRGEGTLNLEQKRIPMKPGDVAHVHRGTPHFFRNEGSSPAAAFVVFSPPYDGRDSVSAEIPGEKKKTEQEEAPQKKPWWKLW